MKKISSYPRYNNITDFTIRVETLKRDSDDSQSSCSDEEPETSYDEIFLTLVKEKQELIGKEHIPDADIGRVALAEIKYPPSLKKLSLDVATIRRDVIWGGITSNSWFYYYPVAPSNLKELYLRIDTLSSSYPELVQTDPNYSETFRFPNVTNLFLHLSTRLIRAGLEEIAPLFPNLESLRLKCDQDNDDMDLDLIEELPNLKLLHVDFPRSYYGNMDPEELEWRILERLFQGWKKLETIQVSGTRLNDSVTEEVQITATVSRDPSEGLSLDWTGDVDKYEDWPRRSPLDPFEDEFIVDDDDEYYIGMGGRKAVYDTETEDEASPSVDWFTRPSNNILSRGPDGVEHEDYVATPQVQANYQDGNVDVEEEGYGTRYGNEDDDEGGESYPLIYEPDIDHTDSSDSEEDDRSENEAENEEIHDFSEGPAREDWYDPGDRGDMGNRDDYALAFPLEEQTDTQNTYESEYPGYRASQLEWPGGL
ncbi:hypothetical protein TWF696_003027 [Orbilia brochopaga]